MFQIFFYEKIRSNIDFMGKKRFLYGNLTWAENVEKELLEDKNQLFLEIDPETWLDSLEMV